MCITFYCMLYAKILQQRIEEQVQSSEEQNSFRKEQLCTETIYFVEEKYRITAMETIFCGRN